MKPLAKYAIRAVLWFWCAAAIYTVIEVVADVMSYGRMPPRPALELAFAMGCGLFAAGGLAGVGQFGRSALAGRLAVFLLWAGLSVMVGSAAVGVVAL